MVPKLVDYLNQAVLISIPVLRSDAKCRPYVLLGVEMQGLWLQDKELVTELASREKEVSVDPSAPVFVPFSSVGFVVLPAPVAKVVSVDALTQGRPIRAVAVELAQSESKRAGAQKKK